MGIRSMFSGVSGLQSHSTWLDVIGNNISNTNTVAYKASRVQFATQISQRMGYASGASAENGLGGVNGSQIGLGTRVQSIQTLFTQGTTLNTGINTDVMIDGEGFLISQVGGNTYYTRSGNMTVDGQGNLVDANGGLIQGWRAEQSFRQRTINSGTQLTITDNSLRLNTTVAPSSIQITKGMTCPARATQTITLSGNMDAALKATDEAHGGMLLFGANLQTQADLAAVPPVVVADPIRIPLGNGANATPAGGVDFNPAKAEFEAGGTNALHQLADFCLPDPTVAGSTVASSVVSVGMDLTASKADVWIWDNSQLMSENPPAFTMNQTVYNSNGLAKSITILGWQVNDLGDGGINAAAGPNQAAYAWYAFDTSDGQAPATANLLGGTGLTNEYFTEGAPGVTTFGVGDLLFFNTDGSLASTGMANNASIIQCEAHIYIPTAPVLGGTPAAATSPIPTIGAEILDIAIDFGGAGILGEGDRGGCYSDAAGSYQLVNGVNTYIPNQTASISGQDGYAEGTLQDFSFDAAGKIQGMFSNGEIIVLGQVAMARMDNNEGLVSVGSNYYTTSANSGSVYVGFAGTAGMGGIVGGALEGSNVDLTTELTNMIIAQRGFEVNAQTVRVGNEVLQTTVNLGR